jgi:hypothetical protein
MIFIQILDFILSLVPLIWGAYLLWLALAPRKPRVSAGPFSFSFIRVVCIIVIALVKLYLEDELASETPKKTAVVIPTVAVTPSSALRLPTAAVNASPLSYAKPSTATSTPQNEFRYAAPTPIVTTPKPAVPASPVMLTQRTCLMLNSLNFLGI